MLQILNKKRGSTLITVVIITTVLMLLSIVLLDSSLKGLILTKRHKNIDFAYYAGQSAIEKWFYIIKGFEGIGEDYDGDINELEQSSIDAFAQFIINKITPSLTSANEFIDVMGVKDTVVLGSTDVECAEVKCKSINNVGAKVVGSNLELTIGIEADSSFSQPSTPYSTSNKVVYAQKKFTFSIPKNDFKLYGAIYTIGDLYVSGKDDEGNLRYNYNDGFNDSFTSYINGDTVVFGSFPRSVLRPEQHYYGGIYAINSAYLSIKGNAYSRSFVRTGPYRVVTGDYLNDNSRIDVYRDAVAQGLHAFGNNNKIVVYNNAYTFDDIEINGEDSFIAVNGSFLGLSRFANENMALRNHDSYSAIVNSAVLHNGLSDASKRSRVAVNGDVIIPGGTFKVKTDTGEVLGQIEDASLAWFEDSISDLPYYKFYPWDTSDVNNPDQYHAEIRNKKENISPNYLGGFGNLLQVWSPITTADRDIETGGDMTDHINSFVNQLVVASLHQNPEDAGLSIPTNLYGSWPYELAANNTLYNSNTGGALSHDRSVMHELKYVNSSDFKIDNIYSSGGNLKYDSNTWSGMPSDNTFIDRVNSILDSTSGDDMKQDLMNYTEVFGKRTYPEAVPGNWNIEDVTLFGEILNKLATRANMYAAVTPNSILIPRDPDRLSNETHNIGDYGVYTTREPADPNPANFHNDAGSYYLFVNADPKVDLVVDGVFNGIIYTAGKVILHDGADVRGSILSAGCGGNYVDGIFKPDFENLALNITADNYDAEALDRGEKAGVKIHPSKLSENPVLKSPPKVDFFLGLTDETDILLNGKATDSRVEYLNQAARENLLRKLYKNGINLFQIL